jgi:hypothetical protein
VIVFRIAHGDHVVRREPDLLEGREHPRPLVDARRQNHHGALVEDDLVAHAEVSNHAEDRRFVRLARRHDDFAHRDRLHAAPRELGHELGRRPFGEASPVARCRIVDDRAVLDDDAREKLGVGKRRQEIVEQAARDEHELSTGGGEARKSGHRRLVDARMNGERFVVVAGEKREAHPKKPRLGRVS